MHPMESRKNALINFSSHARFFSSPGRFVCATRLSDTNAFKSVQQSPTESFIRLTVFQRLTVFGGDFAPLGGRNSFATRHSFFPSTNLEAGTHREEVIKNLSGIWWPFFFIGVLYFQRFATISRSDFDIAVSLSLSPSFPRVSTSTFSL